MSTPVYELMKGPNDRTLGDLFKRLFVVASRGWLVPVLAVPGDALDPAAGERLDPETGYTEYDGPARTAELAAELERTGVLPPLWCTLAVQLPKGRRMQRCVVLRGTERRPLAVLETADDRLRLRFPCDGEPIVARRMPDSALEQERWELAARLAREELEEMLARLRAADEVGSLLP